MAHIDGHARLALVRRTELLDSLPEVEFDRFTRLATVLLGIPVSLVSVVDDQRQFFKSAQGLPEPWATLRQTPLTHSFCAHVVTKEMELVVEDARTDERVRENLAVRDLAVVAYAGMPIVVRNQPLGAFCAIDDKPRAWSARDLGVLRDLAAAIVAQIDLRMAARELEEQRRMTTTLLESLGDGVLALDHRRVFTVANSRARGWFPGAAPGEPLPDRWPTMFQSVREDGTAFLAAEGALARGLRGETTDGLTFTVARDAGPPRWLEATGRPVKDEAGRTIGAIAVYRDVTERVLQARYDEESLATILDSIADALVVTDRDGRVLRMNRAAQSMTGWDEVEALGRPALDVLCIEHGNLLRTRDDGARPVAVSAAPLAKRGEAPTGATVYLARDVTLELASKAALVASEQRYRELYDKAPDLLVTADPLNGTILDCNRAVCRELGYAKDELIGQAPFILYDPVSMEPVKATLASLERVGSLIDVERRLRRKDGTTLDVSANIQTFRDASGRMTEALAVYRDVSRRKQADADRGLLLEIGTSLDVTTDPDEARARVSSALGRYLGVDRCVYASVDADEVMVTFHDGHASPGVSPLVGAAPISSFGDRAAITPFREGFVVIVDSAEDPRTRAKAGAFAGVGLGAFVSAPEWRHGIWRGVLVVASAMPRRWEEREVALVRLVAERTWLWLERLDLLAKRRDEQVARAVQETERKFRVLVEGVADYAIFMLDVDGAIATWNAGSERLTQYAEADVVGRSYALFFRADHLLEDRPRTILDAARREGRFEEEALRVRRDGSEFLAHVLVTAIRDRDGELEGFAAVTRDVTEERRRDDELVSKQEELATGLREREVLLQEVHHRVKNNLQVISSLINMQGRKLESGVAKNALLECGSRVQAIALIHERLYQTKDFGRVPFAEYVQSLVANVFLALGTPPDCTLSLDVADLPLTIDRAVPCGLVLNELVTNAVKHGLATGRPGELRITLDATDGATVRLAVRDNGPGLPDGFAMHGSKSMGMRLVTTLASQLKGKVRASNDEGASFVLTFPLEG